MGLRSRASLCDSFNTKLGFALLLFLSFFPVFWRTPLFWEASLFGVEAVAMSQQQFPVTLILCATGKNIMHRFTHFEGVRHTLVSRSRRRSHKWRERKCRAFCSQIICSFLKRGCSSTDGRHLVSPDITNRLHLAGGGPSCCSLGRQRSTITDTARARIASGSHRSLASVRRRSGESCLDAAQLKGQQISR